MKINEFRNPQAFLDLCCNQLPGANLEMTGAFTDKLDYVYEDGLFITLTDNDENICNCKIHLGIGIEQRSMISWVDKFNKAHAKAKEKIIAVHKLVEDDLNKLFSDKE